MDLIKTLIKKKIIKKDKGFSIENQVKEKKGTVEEIILKENILSEKALFILKGKLLKIPVKEIVASKIPSKVLELIPKESAQYYKMIPLKKTKGEFEVGMVYPENSQAQEALKFLARQNKLSYKYFLITLSDFRKCIDKYGAPQREMKKALEILETQIKGGEEEITLGEKVKFKRLTEDAPIIKIVSVILKQAVEGKASDIHIEPTRDNLRVRYRLDGILYPTLFLPLKIHPSIIARIKILSGLKIDETRIPQDGRFSSEIKGENIDFRVSTFPTTLGEKIVLRVLDPEKGIKSLEKIGLEKENLIKIKNALGRTFGMILLTGPTGSGKTTTLYSLLKILNKEGVNIVTLEDPVEYFMAGINQSQVRPEIDYTFAKGLRQILRQDPDIIMVGEIRDEETAELAVHAALTGHLVFSTLHTNNASDVIPRLIDMGIRPFLIPPSLALALSQRLVRKLCPFCKKRVEASAEDKEFILNTIKKMSVFIQKKIKIPKPLYVFEPNGCEKCNNKGYSGRIGIFEIIEMTDNLSNIILKNPDKVKILQEARNQEMILMEEDGVLKVLQGITTVKEIMRVTKEK
ncbi:type II/IV secretion system protein [Candidatus Atribacteria bacterium MT.SAG.1]|nr:type II/IV secretion system protein [Candidatus Atribacteria bacterium MT.SAG.1]